MMTRRPPSIQGVFSTSGGGLKVAWTLDTFFPDSAEPERVLVDLNGNLFENLDGDQTSVDVPQATVTALGGSSIIVSVSFWWSGSPAEEQQSSVVVPVQGAPGPGNEGVYPATKPVVSLVRVQARTPTSPASIEIAWRTNNHNDGNIFWGPVAAPRSFVRNIRPANASVTTGMFATDQPLTSGVLYSFTVEVRNTLHSPEWLATTALIRAAAEAPKTIVPTTSLRQYLQQTGRPITSSLAPLVGPSNSIRKMILG